MILWFFKLSKSALAKMDKLSGKDNWILIFVNVNWFSTNAKSLICFCRFVLSNGKTSRNGSFEIVVEMVDRILPSLSSNKGLSVPQGSSMILSPDCLAMSDPDTPPNALTFVIVQPPQYGRLLLGGTTLTAGSNFTQSNIQEYEVTYKHDGGPSQIDRFAFTASDSTNQGFLLDGRLHSAPVFFTIQVHRKDEFFWQRLCHNLWKFQKGVTAHFTLRNAGSVSKWQQSTKWLYSY